MIVEGAIRLIVPSTIIFVFACTGEIAPLAPEPNERELQFELSPTWFDFHPSVVGCEGWETSIQAQNGSLEPISLE